MKTKKKQINTRQRFLQTFFHKQESIQHKKVNGFVLTRNIQSGRLVISVNEDKGQCNQESLL